MWDNRQIKVFVKQTKERLGWKSISPEDLREALLAQTLLGVLAGQHGETVRVKDIQELWTKARIEAGLYTPEKEGDG